MDTVTDVNILINGDENFVRILATALRSFRKNLPASQKINCYYAFFRNRPLSDRSIMMLKKQLTKSDAWIQIDVPDFGIDTRGARWSDQVFLKILALFFLPHSVEHLLYFDGDVVFTNTVLPFYARGMVMDEAVLGTKECSSNTSASIARCKITDGVYLNGGVLFFRPHQIRKIWDSPETFLKEYASAPFKKLCLEQDFLNYRLSGQKAWWPDDTYMHFCDEDWIEDKMYLSSSPSIYHFAGVEKPWYKRSTNRYNSLFWKYGRKVYPFSTFLSVRCCQEMQRLKRATRRYFLKIFHCRSVSG